MRLLVLSLLALSNLVFADEAVCKKCQVIREYNAAHPENNYYYYDDYLKDQAKKNGEKSTTEKADTEKSETEKTNAEKPKLGCKKCGKKKHSVIADCGCGKKKKRSELAGCGCGKKKKRIEETLACKQCGGDKKPAKEYGDFV